MITLQTIIAAYEKMKGIVHMTPLDYSSTFSELAHNEIYLKLENLQKTGSFKVRGSYDKYLNKRLIIKASPFGIKTSVKQEAFQFQLM